VGRKAVAKLLCSDQAIPLVHSYFKGARRKNGDPFPFSGAEFERLAGGGHRPDSANRITYDDIVAVSMLGVRIPAFASLALLEDRAEEITSLLEQIPRLQKLGSTDIDELLDPTSPAMRLWMLLMSISGLKETKVSKLMARKRPHLVPVFDEVIGTNLGPIDGHWARVHGLVTEHEHRLAAIRTAVRLGTRVPLIRIIDVAVWMRYEGRRQLGTGSLTTPEP
jgi:hypothetical protein